MSMSGYELSERLRHPFEGLDVTLADGAMHVGVVRQERRREAQIDDVVIELGLVGLLGVLHAVVDLLEELFVQEPRKQRQRRHRHHDRKPHEREELGADGAQPKHARTEDSALRRLACAKDERVWSLWSYVAGPKSKELFERAQRSMPGGVNSPVRAFRAVGGEPPFIARAKGAYLWDEDGTKYTDYVGSWGPMILGHAHADVVRAVATAAERGTSYGAPTALEVRYAEKSPGALPIHRDASCGLERDGSDDGSAARRAWIHRT